MTMEAKQSPDLREEDQDGVGTVDAGEPDVEVELRAELAAANRELDRLRRAAAEFDNLRKRAERERLESRWNTAAGPLREFLDVVDNLDRALQAEASADDLRTGVEMIRRQMADLLRRFDVEPVAGTDAPFDPNVHQAVAREESAEVDEPTVVQELQAGYTMESRLLRAAMVRVAVPAAPVASRDGVGEDGGGADADAASGSA